MTTLSKTLNKFFNVKLSLNEDYILKSLFYPRVNSTDTGLLNISNLFSGEALIISKDDVKTKQYWDPVNFVSKPYRKSLKEANEILKDTIIKTLTTKSAYFEKIFLYFSGGLDSAIIASIIKKFSPQTELFCFNYSISSSIASHEYDYAKACSSNLGINCHHFEIDPFDSNILDEGRYDLFPHPSPQYIGTPLWEKAQEIAQINDCNIIWDGDGGDQIFYGFQTSLILNDYFYFNKNLSGYLKLSFDVAKLCDDSIFPLLRESWNNLNKLKVEDIYAIVLHEKNDLIEQGLVRPIQIESLIPYFILGRDFPLGKTMQIEGVLNVAHNKVPLRTYPIESMHPLANQPLVELCLNLPSYYLAKSGNSRGLVREALKGIVPSTTLDRYTKGGTTKFITKWFSSPRFQEYLIDGYLTKLGYIDRAQLEKTFRYPCDFQTKQSILDFLPTEIWLRQIHCN